MLVLEMILFFPYVVTAELHLHHTDSSFNNTLMPRQLLASLSFVFQSVTQVSDTLVLLKLKQRETVTYTECNLFCSTDKLV